MGWRQRISLRIFSRSTVDTIKRETHCVCARVLCIAPNNLFTLWRSRRATALRLNIGSGDHLLPDWISIDLLQKATIRWDVRWGIPFLNESISEIHCEHFLEHLYYPDEALALLKEIARVLKPNGRLRLVVPDGERYIRAYVDGDKSFWEGLKDLGGAEKPFETEMEILNQSFRMGGEHHFAYDYKTLKRLLSQVDLSHVIKDSFRSDAYIDRQDAWRKLESLYLVATKTGEPTAMRAL